MNSNDIKCSVSCERVVSHSFPNSCTHLVGPSSISCILPCLGDGKIHKNMALIIWTMVQSLQLIDSLLVATLQLNESPSAWCCCLLWELLFPLDDSSNPVVSWPQIHYEWLAFQKAEMTGLCTYYNLLLDTSIYTSPHEPHKNEYLISDATDKPPSRNLIPYYLHLKVAPLNFL